MATLANICFSKFLSLFFCHFPHHTQWIPRKKMKKRFCQCFTQGNAFRVRDSANKRASAPPQAGSYFGNARLQGHYYPRHKSLGTNWVFYGQSYRKRSNGLSYLYSNVVELFATTSSLVETTIMVFHVSGWPKVWQSAKFFSTKERES
jgi:hypothetical protein